MRKKKNLHEKLKKQKQKKYAPNERPTFTLLSKLKNHHQFKKILLAISSSLVIGLIFGFVTLKMMKQEDPENTNVVHSTTVTPEEQEEGERPTFDPFTMYVIQGGLFSEKENANEWGTSFEEAGFPVVSWERDEEFFLFLGVFESQPNAEHLAARIQEKGLDIFVKKWEIRGGQADLTEKEEDFLRSFLNIWHKSVESIENKNGLLHEDWENLLDSSDALTDKMKNFAETIREDINQVNTGETNEIMERHFLLSLIKKYEQLLE